MNKLIIPLIVVASIAGLILGISIFLGPNDLAGCPNVPSNATRCGAADAIVAVSGGDTNARTDAAIQRYREGWAPILIFSGAAQDEDSPSNAQTMKARAIQQGVPADHVVIEEFARNTAENAANTSEFINSRNLNRIILVTSAYHQRRAGLEFGAKLGPGVQIVNAPASEDKQWDKSWWLTPRGWWLALGEIAKIIAHYANGGST